MITPNFNYRFSKSYMTNLYTANSVSLDRIDNSKGYSKDNCRWTTMSVQINNTRRAEKANTLTRQITLGLI
jgi:hypothetical protein